jgi:hypothetical protein
MNWSYPPRIQILVQLLLSCRTRWRRQEEEPEGCLGSRVNARQKPNCRSPVQPTLAAGLRFWKCSAPVPSLARPAGRQRRRRARVAGLVRFLTSQIKWNNSYHISQANDPWNSNMVLLVLFTITHHRFYWLNGPSP